jgi:hypothetical protein
MTEWRDRKPKKWRSGGSLALFDQRSMARFKEFESVPVRFAGKAKELQKYLELSDVSVKTWKAVFVGCNFARRNFVTAY